MRRMVSAGKTSKSKATLTKRRRRGSRRNSSPALSFVVCVNSGGYVDLEPLKLYKALHDPAAKAEGMLRVVDGSGDDYLYPKAFFRPVKAPRKLFQIVEEATEQVQAVK